MGSKAASDPVAPPLGKEGSNIFLLLSAKD